MSNAPEFVDLHCHSYASSDGRGYPADIARYFSDAGFRAFSLTDHDLILGQAEAAVAARELGIEFIPGVEISATVTEDPDISVSGSVHVLCYFFAQTPDVVELTRCTGSYYGTLRSIIDYLRQRDGIPLQCKELQQQLDRLDPQRRGWPGIQREAFSNLMIQHGVLNPEDAASAGIPEYEWRRSATCALIKGCKKRMKELGVELSNGVTEAPVNREIGRVRKVMREAGAVMILAHPGAGQREPSESEKRRINLFLDRYVDGVEVFHHRNSPAYRRMLMDIINKRGRPYTGGGDRHNFTVEAGQVSEAPVACLDRLREARP